MSPASSPAGASSSEPVSSGRLRFALCGVGYESVEKVQSVREGERVQYQEFIEQVQQRAGLDSFERAEAASRATLTTLGEYLSGREGIDLASQLPQGLDQYLRQQPPDRSMIFSLEDFLQMVGENEEVGLGEAESHVRAVLGVLQEAVSEGEMEDVRRQFPSEFDPLFGL